MKKDIILTTGTMMIYFLVVILMGIVLYQSLSGIIAMEAKQIVFAYKGF